MRNPDWTEEELLLAYRAHLLLRANPRLRKSQVAQELSETLRGLSIHPHAKRESTFRSPDGVLRRIRYFDQIARGDLFPGRELYRDVPLKYGSNLEEIGKRCDRIIERFRQK